MTTCEVNECLEVQGHNTDLIVAATNHFLSVFILTDACAWLCLKGLNLKFDSINLLCEDVRKETFVRLLSCLSLLS